MLGVLYLILCILVGRELTEVLLFGRSTGRSNRIWVVLPASFGIGTLLMSWVVYGIAWLASVAGGLRHPLLVGNLVTMPVAALLLVVLYIGRKRKKWIPCRRLLADCDSKLLKKEAIFFGLLLVFVTWSMFYTFHIRDGSLYCGYTVFSDYAPHTAMIRSFSWGDNFPTQYPHFGGEDVKYHFMFQFLAGNLEYLGLPLDWAYNSVSILSLTGFFMLLYMLAQRVTGRFAAGVLALVFVVFRSGAALFLFVWEHLQAGDLWTALMDNFSFIGYSSKEDWGLWNYNVYLNQRHLAFGLLIAALAIWVYLEWLQAGLSHPERGVRWLWGRLCTKEAWRSKSVESALLLGMILGLCAFWNGAALIGGLLVLCGFALFSDGKLDYALTAAAAIGFAVLQSRIFIRGSAVETSFYFGFLADQKTLPGVLLYLLEIAGPVFVGIFVLGFFVNREKRALAVSFLFPVVFAFTVSLTPDVTVNHKYIMIAYAFLTILWAWAVVRLWDRHLPGRLAAAVLAISLTATGIYDFVVIVRDNDSAHRVSVSLNSDLTAWLRENLDHEDLILTPEYSINEVTLSGAMLYLGWPYYAWSAGYDTSYRAVKALKIYTTEDAKELARTVQKEGITYILFEEGMELDGSACREDVIAGTYPLAYQSEDGRIRIYKTT